MTTPSSRTGVSGVDQFFTGKAGEGGRVRTGIAELDQMLRGGFMKGDAVMVAGSAGCGKTTLALQYLVNGAKLGEAGLYVTFEEMPDQIYRDAKNLGWDLRKLEEESKFRIAAQTNSRGLVEPSCHVREGKRAEERGVPADYAPQN
ncbi:MAG: hypothetical protein AUF79_18135 [Crenarchaeota archaeon 13_1_20CM_2_51_8]|nr:MAG: hypothetical protein AUF79_18135 [Crenarchaeota archaeon 13_1_20CM_2_51_8]